jgi:L-iditol 2-dehydrogenase
MKALVKTQKGDGFIEVRDMPIPKLPGEDWVLIRVKAAGVCGTDLHIWHDQFPYWPPVILGHEFAGEIVETGSGVTRFRAGDRVVAEPHTLACGSCELCREGKIQLCASKRSPGWGIHGGFAEYVAMPEVLLHRIPTGMPYDIAALAEPMAITVHHVTERCGIGCQNFVVVTGAGPIGILAAFVAKSVGAGTVVVTGMSACSPVRFGGAQALGADVIINVEQEDPVARVMEMTDGRGADVVIETSGAGRGIAQSIALLKKCGRMCAIGLGAPASTIPWSEAVQKSLDIVCCMSSGYSAWDKALSLMASTDKDLKRVITHHAALDEWEAVFHDLEAERGIKAMFLPEL